MGRLRGSKQGERGWGGSSRPRRDPQSARGPIYGRGEEESKLISSADSHSNRRTNPISIHPSTEGHIRSPGFSGLLKDNCQNSKDGGMSLRRTKTQTETKKGQMSRMALLAQIWSFTKTIIDNYLSFATFSNEAKSCYWAKTYAWLEHLSSVHFII